MQAETPMERRCRFSALTMADRGKRTRSGVRLKPVLKVQIAISPDTWRSRSIGLAPSWLVNPGRTRRQQPPPKRTARATILLPKILATSPRELFESGCGEGIGKAKSRIQNSEFRIQKGGRSLRCSRMVEAVISR